MSVLYLFEHGDPVLILVFLTLVAMSVITWGLIFGKTVALRRIKGENRRFFEAFWNAEHREAGEQVARASTGPLARMAGSAMAGLRHYQSSNHTRLGDACSSDEFLVRTIRNAMNRESGGLQRGMAMLASIGSTAPYVGLFGTVWGIYHALLEISAAGSASMEVVAGPLGEALVATAAGLAVAIPAVLAYNAFARGNRVVAEEMDGFAHDLHAFLTTGATCPLQPACQREAA